MVSLKLRSGIAAGFVLAAAVATQAATTTTVINPVGNDPIGLETALIMAYGYGGGSSPTFSTGTDTTSIFGANGAGQTMTFTKGGNTLTFTRIGDNGSPFVNTNLTLTGNGNLNGNVVAGASDQIWNTTGNGAFRVEAKVSGDSPYQFGYATNLTTGAGKTQLVSIANGDVLPGSLVSPVVLGNPLT